MNQKIIPVSDVFGVQPFVSEWSYVDRGSLDEKIQSLLARKQHIALKGSSKCGKSWLRQKCIPNAIVVHCSVEKTVGDIYEQALSALGIKLIVSEETTDSIKGSVEANADAGFDILGRVLGKLNIGASLGAEKEHSEKTRVLKHDVTNLSFIADIIKTSSRPLIIEDFHYLKSYNRLQFAQHLKTFWDYGCFVIIIGIWTRSNLLSYLNPDLTNRINEETIDWNNKELEQVLRNGADALNIEFGDVIIQRMISDSYQNVGMLQTLAARLLDETGVKETHPGPHKLMIDSEDNYENAALATAKNLDSRFQRFAQIVTDGIRRRNNSTGIYPVMMHVITEKTSDADLIGGMKRADLYAASHEIESRIQQGNMKIVLSKIDELQQEAADEGMQKGIVLSYDESTDTVEVVDRELLFYRKYCSTNWPWQELINELEQSKDSPMDFEDFLNEKAEQNS